MLINKIERQTYCQLCIWKTLQKGWYFTKVVWTLMLISATFSTYLKIQFLVQIRPDGRLPGVGLALAQHVLTEVFHGVCHFWELHPTVALEGGQSFSFAVSVPETAFGVDKPATNFDNRRSKVYCYSQTEIYRNGQIQFPCFWANCDTTFFTPKYLQTPHCSQKRWLKKLNKLMLPISEWFHLFPTGFQFFG